MTSLPFEAGESNFSDLETTVGGARKTRVEITRRLVESFNGLQGKNLSFKEIADILNISICTCRRLYKKYLEGEFLDLSQYKSAGEKKSVTSKDITFEKSLIASELSLNPCTNLTSLSQTLYSFHNEGHYSKPTVSRIIKKMNYTRKTLTLVPINRNSNENKLVRFQYASSLINISNEKLIFLDESGFNLHLHQKLGYSPKNTKCFINVPNSKGTNVSLLCAIQVDGILASKAKVGSFKSVDMVDFIHNELVQLGPHERKYIVMDNTSIHKTAEVREALALKNYILMFLPPTLLNSIL